MQNITRKQWILAYAVSAGLLFLAALQVFGIHRPLTVSFLDVGQGDAILIQTPEFHNILIDAGPDSLVVDQMGKQLGFFDKTIDLFILTHPHQDHYGGIMDVLQKYEIKQILLTGVVSGDPLYVSFLTEVKKRGIPLLFNQNNEDLRIGPHLYLDLLFPLEGESWIGQNPDNRNNSSIAARLVRKTAEGWEPLALLTGDAEQEEEKAILLSGQDVSGPILKLGHHGSRTATSDVFLSAVQPKTAIISAGKDNSFGHPHPETMEKVKGLETRQTMREGNITINF